MKDVTIHRIAQDAVMKASSDSTPDEAATMRLVRASTTIPVPEVKRNFIIGRARVIVMDYIPGRTLEECWGSLGVWSRIRVIWALRRYVRELRNVLVPGVPRSVQFPGPVASEPQMCWAYMFTMYVSTLSQAVAGYMNVYAHDNGH